MINKKESIPLEVDIVSLGISLAMLGFAVFGIQAGIVSCYQSKRGVFVSLTLGLGRGTR